MNQKALNLKELEQLAYRRTYQDGLLDIYLGGILASFAVFGFTIFPGTDMDSLQVLLYYLIGMGLSTLVFWLGKRYITLPRIGLVKFGPARQKRTARPDSHPVRDRRSASAGSPPADGLSAFPYPA